MRSAGREFLRLGGVAIVVGGLPAAPTLLFVPLSVQRASAGAVVGFCGPGHTSDNAVQVRLDPGIVNTGDRPGQAGSAAQQQQQLQQFCPHQADDQLIESAVVAVLALLTGLPMIAARGRRDDTPLSPGAAP